ncbi:hypothetical protein [Sigmofec virus UA08Rod_6044]|uniref:Uncharacterized protein n=1 Tax=Sigmofec virus UA08Rod_6044 TaxID=2929448 RepID=A0A976R6V2_9VIRU|nr:hypothetical protein [Sigmofec virus UA08Rod_6044]
MNEKNLKIIAKWIKINKKLKEINDYIYKHTEIFEEKYTSEYREELFNFFAGKITRFTKDHNKLMNLLKEKEKDTIHYINLEE